MIFNIKKILKPDDYVSEKTRAKYDKEIDELPVPPKFDKTKSKYQGKNK
jgi:hypothetical protein